MKTKSNASRRRFFMQAGAALAVPLAASAARPRSAADDDVNARLAALEDVSAIRELQQAFARCVNSGAHDEARRLFAKPAAAQLDARIRRLSAHGFGEHDSIELSADRTAATARVQCTVETETPIGPSCTLVEMARLQGEGVLRHAAKRVLVGTYVKQDDTWRIERLAFEPV